MVGSIHLSYLHVHVDTNGLPNGYTKPVSKDCMTGGPNIRPAFSPDV